MTNSVCKYGVSFALGLFAVVSTSSAAIWNLEAKMDGLQEVPPNNLPGAGLFAITYDDQTNLFDLAGSVRDLSITSTTQITGFHFHRGAFGTNGPVVVNLSPLGHFMPVGGPGDFDWMQTAQGAFPEADEGLLLTGGFYMNLHTTTIPGGEIRGQIYVVPEPATLMALAAGLGAIVARRRRK